MNIFRLAADMLHLLSFIVMLYRMKTQRSCRGVSLKSQILFLIVFCCRYLVLCAQREAREARGAAARSADPRRFEHPECPPTPHCAGARCVGLCCSTRLRNRRARAACGRRVGTAGGMEVDRAVAPPQHGSGWGRQGVCA